MTSRRWVIGWCLVATVLLLSACGNEFPEAEGDVAWVLENGAIDDVPDEWEQTRSSNRKGYELGGERFPTLVTREYKTLQSATEIAEAMTASAEKAGWELGWSICGEREARIGFRYPQRDDVLLTSRIEPAGEGIKFKVTAVFDRQGWGREGIESMECFDGIRERLRMLEELPPLETLELEQIEAQLTASEVAEIYGRPNITSRPHDGLRVQYRDGDEFIITIERVFGSSLPELAGYDRDDIYLLAETEARRTYRVGLGDVSVDLVDYQKSDPEVIDQIAAALKN